MLLKYFVVLFIVIKCIESQSTDDCKCDNRLLAFLNSDVSKIEKLLLDKVWRFRYNSADPQSTSLLYGDGNGGLINEVLMVVGGLLIPVEGLVVFGVVPIIRYLRNSLLNGFAFLDLGILRQEPEPRFTIPIATFDKVPGYVFDSLGKENEKIFKTFLDFRMQAYKFLEKLPGPLKMLDMQRISENSFV